MKEFYDMTRKELIKAIATGPNHSVTRIYVNVKGKGIVAFDDLGFKLLKKANEK